MATRFGASSAIMSKKPLKAAIYRAPITSQRKAMYSLGDPNNAPAKPKMTGVMAKIRADNEQKTRDERNAFIQSRLGQLQDNPQAAQAMQDALAQGATPEQAMQAAQAAQGQGQQEQGQQEQQYEDDGPPIYRTENVTPEDLPRAAWEDDVPWQEEQGFAYEGAFSEDPSPLRGITFFGEDGSVETIGFAKTPVALIPVVDRRRGNVDGADQSLMAKATREALRATAESLVRRSRQGDQNAMAIISEVRRNSLRGNKRAQLTHDLIGDYINHHPMTEPEGMKFGEEDRSDDIIMSACVALANGPPLTVDAIKKLSTTFGNEDDSRLFVYGVVNCNRSGVKRFIQRLSGWKAQVGKLGLTVGQARKIQKVRDPSQPVQDFNPTIAWELGE